MEDKRKFNRCLTQLEAKYFLEEEEQKGSWEECTVINISRKGIGIKFHACKKFNTGSIIHLAIIVPGEPDPIMIKGTLGWIKQKENYFISGIELTEELDDAKWDKFC